MSNDADGELRLRGVDHLAIGTDDMAATLRFYVDVLGFSLVRAMRSLPRADDSAPVVDVHEKSARSDFRRPPAAPQFDNIRHYVLDVGNDTLMAVFEYPKGTEKAVRDSVAGLQHIAFHADRQSFDAVLKRLADHGVDHLGPFALPDGHTTVNFFDPNGIRLECVTDWDAEDYATVDLIRQPFNEMRSEVATLFEDPAVVDELCKAAQKP